MSTNNMNLRKESISIPIPELEDEDYISEGVLSANTYRKLYPAFTADKEQIEKENQHLEFKYKTEPVEENIPRIKSSNNLEIDSIIIHTIGNERGRSKSGISIRKSPSRMGKSLTFMGSRVQTAPGASMSCVTNEEWRASVPNEGPPSYYGDSSCSSSYTYTTYGSIVQSRMQGVEVMELELSIPPGDTKSMPSFLYTTASVLQIDEPGHQGDELHVPSCNYTDSSLDSYPRHCLSAASTIRSNSMISGSSDANFAHNVLTKHGTELSHSRNSRPSNSCNLPLRFVHKHQEPPVFNTGGDLKQEIISNNTLYMEERKSHKESPQTNRVMSTNKRKSRKDVSESVMSGPEIKGQENNHPQQPTSNRKCIFIFGAIILVVLIVAGGAILYKFYLS